jgi:methyl-accepting chemotaxis protein
MATNYTEWLADTKEEETTAVKKVAYMADFLKTCYGIDTTTRNPDADIRTTPMNQQYIEAVNQTADQLDNLYSELDSMMEDIKRMQEAIAELSDIRRELATTTPADFEN